ncbi:DUF6174 domain-containing protein [Streptomyces sp. NPDC013178]|uniref:DUF6174 domain-containing protein n=1 Tax=Streptomyces sp. NPDC013178 TaxID=3155118 RepID=UPI0033DF283F
MTAVRSQPRSVTAAAAVLIGALLCATAACGSTAPPESAERSGPSTAWQEPASYTYTLTSTTQVLAGTFRVKVQDGRVAEAVGLDEDSRRQVRELPGEVPSIGELLKRLEQARSDDADTAEAEYASDGHPLRISLDWEKNAIDDEALYVISAYEPAAGQGCVQRAGAAVVTV